MTETMTLQDNLTLNLTEDIHVRASLEATFEALLVQMGPENEGPDGTPLSMTLEAHPGGRWFRDLGGNNGHLWGFVQAIKRPDAARDHRAAVHVGAGRLERAVPPERGGRRHADLVQAFRARLRAGRLPPGPHGRMASAVRAHQEAR